MTGKKFIFTSAEWSEDRKTAFFDYKIETSDQTFELRESIELPVSCPVSYESESLLRALHIALGISYYKAFIPPEIEYPYYMTEVEATFWNTVYSHGLGEFLYKNSLSKDNLAKFSAQTGTETLNQNRTAFNDSALLGIGGGKDSIVAGELLKEIGIKPNGFVLATGEILGQTKSVADIMKIDLLAVRRNVDKQILEINKLEGAYNGHIPISLIFGLVGALLATSTKQKYVVVANEASASIPQVKWEGVDVNHQWSKSIEFERLFQDYLHAYVSEELHYFSAIRPLTSVAIAKIFANYPKYFEVFTSDNSLFKINQTEREHPRWSLNSSKSLSSFILLSPWLNEKDLDRTFGRNFLDEDSLSEMFLDLLGATNNSVLDCVGTPDELKYSLSKLSEQGKFQDSKLILLSKEKELAVDNTHGLFSIEESVIPNKISDKLKAAMENNL